MIKFELSELLVVFDELLPLTNEEQKDYWFHATSDNGVMVTLFFSVYDQTANIIVRCNDKIAATSIALKGCFVIQVLDEQRKVIEILAQIGSSQQIRCLLALRADTLLEVEMN